MKKLFVSDLDGTLFYNDGKNTTSISEDNLNAIKEYVAKGNIFAIASARNHQFIDRLTEMLGFRPLYIAYNGAYIIIDDYIIEHSMHLKDYQLFEKYFKDNDIDGFVSTLSEDVFYQSNRKKYPFNDKTYDKSVRHKLMYEGINTSKNTYSTNKKCHKILLVLRRDLVETVKKDLKDKYGNMYEFVSSDVDNIDVVKKGCSKGKAVSILSEYYNIDEDHIGVIGDSENDISMFLHAKYRFAMRNGIKPLKEKANYIVDNVNEAIKIFTK